VEERSSDDCRELSSACRRLRGEERRAGGDMVVRAVTKERVLAATEAVVAVWGGGWEGDG
jgi:hypothetical protein